MLSAETQLLGHTGDTEWLTGKATAKHFVARDVRNSDSMNVTMRLFSKVGFVGLLTELVPIARENAFPTDTFERKSEAAYSAKEINELERLLAVLP